VATHGGRYTGVVPALLEPETGTRKAALSPRIRVLRLAAGLALLCLPSLALVWSFRDLPHFGVLQDDSLYYAGAKAIANGSGYRILSLPAEPFQTKYPPLYPLYLALAWLANPSFPANLTIALGLSWLSLPAILLLLYWWRGSWLLLTLVALNPYVLFFASNLGSELFFLVFLLAAMLASEKHPILGGLIGGAGYLVRTAGIALLPAAIVYFLIRRRPRAALSFAAGMLPAVVGWTLWCYLHQAPGRDIVTLCYTNYLGYQFLNVGWDNFGVVLWKNFDSLLEAMGSLVFPQVLTGLASKAILQPIAIAMIAGCVRLFRGGEARLYALFGLFSAALLLTWHFPANQRFILPLAPLLLAGFYKEMAHLFHTLRGAFRHRDRSQRVVAYGFSGLLAVVLVTGLGLQIYMSSSVVPQLFARDRRNDSAFSRVYTWIGRNLPENSNILWEQDVVYYLATGRHASSFPIPSRQWYAYGFERDVDYYRNIDEFARSQHLGYILLPAIGSQRNEEELRVAAENPRLESIHIETGGVLYRVR
jgi:hypothetical protein